MQNIKRRTQNLKVLQASFLFHSKFNVLCFSFLKKYGLWILLSATRFYLQKLDQGLGFRGWDTGIEKIMLNIKRRTQNLRVLQAS